MRSNASASTMRRASSKSRWKRSSSSSTIRWAAPSRWMPSWVSICTSITVPLVPCSTRSDATFTSLAFSPKIAQNFFRRQRGLALGRDLADQHVAGVDLGTDVDHAGFIQARGSRCSKFGMSRTSLAPSFVSRAITTSSSMWIEV